MKKILRVLFITLILILAVALIAGCSKDEKKNKKERLPSLSPDSLKGETKDKVTTEEEAESKPEDKKNVTQTEEEKEKKKEQAANTPKPEPKKQNSSDNPADNSGPNLAACPPGQNCEGGQVGLSDANKNKMDSLEAIEEAAQKYWQTFNNKPKDEQIQIAQTKIKELEAKRETAATQEEKANYDKYIDVWKQILKKLNPASS
jgi:hypothetical protein